MAEVLAWLATWCWCQAPEPVLWEAYDGVSGRAANSDGGCVDSGSSTDGDSSGATNTSTATTNTAVQTASTVHHADRGTSK
jgi:hypothetical protein